MVKRILLSPFFIFPMLTCIFFWPVSLQLFTFKNDALTYYYPVRTLIGDALNNYELPLWTPYINMGYPLHADMQSGAWNPVTWIFGFVTNYSLASFHYELMFYLAFGGIGFYYLGREYGWSKYTALLIAFGYEFSGPIIDSIQFTACISSACYIPFIFLFFRRFLNNNRYVSNALLTAFFLYLLFTGGYPALFIITVYLLISFFLFALFSVRDKIVLLKKLVVPLALLSGAFVLFSLPALISFINHLQYIDRGNKQGLAFVLENSMSPVCMLSLISPFSTTSPGPFFDTNMLMRNSYAGIVPLAFMIYALIAKRGPNTKEIRFSLFAAFTLFGLSWGSHFFLRQLAYYTLPLMDTFRHPGLFRFFGVIFLLRAVGFIINDWDKKSEPILLRKIIASILIAVVLAGVVIILITRSGLLPGASAMGQLKSLIQTLSFQQRFLVQLPFMIITAGLFYFIISKKKSLYYLLPLSLFDLFFATQLNIPVTVIGARSFKETEQLIHRNPVRFPLPGDNTIEQNVFNSIDSSNTTGSKLPFEKKIGRNDYFITPGNLSLQDRFYESSARTPVFKNRLLYFADTLLPVGTDQDKPGLKIAEVIPMSLTAVTGLPAKTNKIEIKKISANSLECVVETSSPTELIFLQNFYPGWKVFVDGSEERIIPSIISFKGVNIKSGKHTVIFRYYPVLVIYSWYISLFALIGSGLYLLRMRTRKSRLSNQHDQGNPERKLHPFQ